MKRYRVTVAKEIALDYWAEQHRDFNRWWHAWRYAHAMRRSGYTTRTERIR